MTIREFNKKTDLIKVTELFYKVFTSEPWNDGWKSTDRVKEYLENIIYTPKFLGFVAIREDKIIGFILGNITVWYTGNNFYLSEMCVDNTLQRSGAGTKLMNHLCESLKEKGVNQIDLLTSRDMFCYDFYKKNDFKLIDDIKLLIKKV